MKKIVAMIILATWLPVILIGLAGLQTIAWWRDTNDGNPWYGLLMIGICAGFLYVASRFNGCEFAKAMESWLNLFDKILYFRLRLRVRIRAIKIRTARDKRLYKEFLSWKGNIAYEI